MTTTEFYRALASKTKQLKTKWMIDGSAIRTRSVIDHCPLSFLANSEPRESVEASKALKMSARGAQLVISAADYVGGIAPRFPHGRFEFRASTLRARKRLLDACGLVE